MKKQILTALVAVLAISTISVPKAQADVLESLKEYGIPCAIAIGLGAVLMKNDGAGMGVAACAGISAATYLTKKPQVDDVKLKLIVDDAVNKQEMKVSEEMDIKIQKSVDEQTARVEEMKKILREVLAERLVKMEEDVRTSVERKLEAGDFMPKLESRLESKMKEQVIMEGKARSRELVNQIVEEVIRQVVAKPIAAPQGNGQ